VTDLVLVLYLELAQGALVDFGLFYYCQGRGVPHDQAYAEMLDQIALAETLGFGECWFAEHHFTDYAILPSPNLMIASALQRTRRIRFGNYVNALPFHHPLRLAAEASHAWNGKVFLCIPVYAGVTEQGWRNPTLVLCASPMG